MSRDFADWVVEQLAPLGGVRARAMFGGFGIYSGQVMFALIAEDVLYLKAAGALAEELAALGGVQFRPRGAGMPYWQAPGEALDDADALVAWGRRALASARP